MSQLNKIKKTLQQGLITGSVITLVGCAATQTAIEHRNLKVSTKLSETIFLDPVSSSQKTVFLQTKNTSDVDINFKPQLASAFKAKGFKVMSNPTDAHYLVQANVLKAGKMSIAASQTALGGGYGSALAGGIAGVAAGSLMGTTSGMIGGGLAGGVIGLAADSLVKDVNYTMITDLQISERVGKGGAIREEFNSHLKNGSASSTNQTYARHSDYQRFRTRVVSNANKVNLKFETAKPNLEAGLVKAIAGIF